MQFLNMHLLYTSFVIVVILTGCNSHFLNCLSVHPKNYLLENQSTKTPGKKRPQLNILVSPKKPPEKVFQQCIFKLLAGFLASYP